MPSFNYMDAQTEIQWPMRSVLMDWVVQVHGRFGLFPETLFLCVNLIDRFLTHKVVSLGKLQLVGATALFIAAKYEEINCPSVHEISFMVENGYSPEEILRAERFMLTMFEYDLGSPGPMSFLRRISKADDYDLETRTLAKYFLEVTIMDERFLASPPSYAAAGAHCLARLILRKGHWVRPFLYSPKLSCSHHSRLTATSSTLGTLTANCILLSDSWSTVAAIQINTMGQSTTSTLSNASMGHHVASMSASAWAFAFLPWTASGPTLLAPMTTERLSGTRLFEFVNHHAQFFFPTRPSGVLLDRFSSPLPKVLSGCDHEMGPRVTSLHYSRQRHHPLTSSILTTDSTLPSLLTALSSQRHATSICSMAHISKTELNASSPMQTARGPTPSLKTP